jgi:hypothetical protein
MKKIARFALPPAILLLLVVPTFARTKSRFEVYGAVSFPQNKAFEITVPQSTVPIKGTQTFSLGGRGGIRLGADGIGHWGQDLCYSYGTNPTKIVTDLGSFGFTSRTHQFSYNALWYPRKVTDKGKVFPYLTAGVGGAFYQLSQTTINEALDPSRAGLGQLRNENVFTFNAGGGLRFRVNSVYGFRIDVRDNMSRAVRYGLPGSSSDPKATVFPISGIFHQIEVSLAFIYYFK